MGSSALWARAHLDLCACLLSLADCQLLSGTLEHALGRMADKYCVGCQDPFVKEGKGYNRKKAYTLASPNTAHQIFPNVSPNSFICNKCIRLLNSRTIKVNGKRKYAESTTTSPFKSPKKKKRPWMETRKRKKILWTKQKLQWPNPTISRPSDGFCNQR